MFKFGLILVFILALFLRTYDLGNIPNGLHIDELNAGYQGYKIIKTGSDIFGNTLPFYIDRFGDFRPAGIFYLSGLATSLFGLETFFIRFPAALVGALMVFPTFTLSLLIFQKRELAIFSSLLIALSPWHIVASRATSESIIALFLTTYGVIFLIPAFKKKKDISLIMSFALFMSSYFFYHTPRLFIPAFLLFLLPILRLLRGKYLILLTLTIVIITVIIGFTNFGKGRFGQTSIFTSREILTKIKDLEDGDQGNIFPARIFHNKPIVFTKAILDQYLNYFSTGFLFQKGGLPDRYAVNDVGLLYYLEFPLLLLGIVYVFRTKRALSFLPLVWLLTGPIAASLTLEDTPNIQRALFMLPALQIIGAAGLYFLLNALSVKIRRVFIIGISLIFIISIIYFLHQYFIHKATNVSFARHEGNQALFSYIASRENEFSAIYIPVYEDLPLYYLFFQKSSTSFLLVDKSQYNNEINIGKYIFVPYSCPVKVFESRPLNVESRVLIVQDPRCRDNPKELKFITTMERIDKTPAYTINEYLRE